MNFELPDDFFTRPYKMDPLAVDGADDLGVIDCPHCRVNFVGTDDRYCSRCGKRLWVLPPTLLAVSRLDVQEEFHDHERELAGMLSLEENFGVLHYYCSTCGEKLR